MTDVNGRNRLIGVDRRTVLGTAAAAGLSWVATATGLAARSGAGVDSASRSGSGLASHVDSGKAWAQERLRGGESFILPSMSKDFAALDEEGVRRDVQHAIRQGFCAILPLSTGLDRAQAGRMRAIVAEEAQDRILVVGTVGSGPWSRVQESVRSAQEAGVSPRPSRLAGIPGYTSST